MYQSQSFPNGANHINDDQKKIAAIAGYTAPDTESIKILGQEQQLNNTQNERLNKNVDRLSNRMTLIQAVTTIPSFAIELNYGIKYLNQCPIQPLINVFLIVHGCSCLVNGIILLVGFLAARYFKRSPTPSPWARLLIVVSSIGQLVYLIFTIAWLIAGQVWVFGAQTHGFQSSNSTDTATYCQASVFWTGFVIIIVTYAIFLIIILVAVGRIMVKRYKMKQETAPTNNEQY